MMKLKTIEDVYKALKKYDSQDSLVLKNIGNDFCIELRLTKDIWFYADSDYVGYNVGKYNGHDHFDDCEDCQEIYDFFKKVLLNTKPLPDKEKDKYRFFMDL